MNDFTSKIINIALICLQAVSSIRNARKSHKSEIRDDSYEKLTQTIVLYRAKAHEMMNDCDSKGRTMTCRMQVHLWTEIQLLSLNLQKQTRTEKDCLKTHLNNATIFKRCYIHLAKLESTWHRANTSYNHFLYDFCRIAQKMTDCCSPVDHRSRTTQSKCVRVAFVLADQSENLTTFLFAPRLSKESCDAHEESLEVLLFVFCLLYSSISVLVYKCFVSVLIKDIF